MKVVLEIESTGKLTKARGELLEGEESVAV